MLIYAIDIDEHESNELTIDIMDYPSGVYFLRCYQAQEIGNFKIIKK